MTMWSDNGLNIGDFDVKNRILSWGFERPTTDMKFGPPHVFDRPLQDVAGRVWGLKRSILYVQGSNPDVLDELILALRR